MQPVEAESSLSSLVRSYLVAEPSSLHDSQVPATLAAGAWNLLDVVKELGDSLQSELDPVRTRARVVEKTEGDKTDNVPSSEFCTIVVNEKLLAAQTLTNFFIAHLEHNATLQPCAKALAALAASPTFGTGEGVQVLQAVFGLTLSSYAQSTRYAIYVLLDTLLSLCRPAILRYKSYIKSYCTLVEGEKDPRNLLLSFAMLKVILIEFDISDSVDELFDVTFCYFPITFTPPPDDPYGIKSDDLIFALRDCLSATSLFARLALPLFLDKIQATSKKSKTQTLEALISCFKIYGAEATGEWAERFSEVFLVEIFHAIDEDTLNLALRAMTELMATLYPDSDNETDGDIEIAQGDETTTDDGLEGIGQKVVQNSLNELREADKSNAATAVKLIAALALSSRRMANLALRKAISLLLEIYRDPDEVSLRPSILSHLATLLAAAPTESSRLILSPFHDELLTRLASATRVESTQSAGLKALTSLAKIKGLLSVEEVAFAVSTLTDALPQSLDGLVELAPLYPTTLVNSTLPVLFRPPAPLFSALASLSGPQLLFSRITSQLLDLLPSSSAVITNKVLLTLTVALANKKREGKPNLDFLKRFLGLFVTSRGDTLRDAARVVSLVVQCFDLAEQTTLSGELNAAFHDRNLVPLLGSSAPSPAPEGDAFPLPLFAAAILAFRPAVAVPAPKLTDFLRSFLRRSVEKPSPEVGWLLGQTVNKRAEGLKEFIEGDVETFWKEAVVAPGPLERRTYALNAFAWIVRGLVVRSDSRGLAYVSYIVSMFEDKEVGRQAALSLDIVAEEGGVMSKANFAVIRILYKQRLLSGLLPTIVDGYREAKDPELAVIYLTALSVLLQHLPKSSTIIELSRLLPLLSTALDLPDARLKVNVIDTLRTLVQESPTDITPSIANLVRKVIKSAVEGESVKLRVASLKFLKEVPETIPYIELHSLKPVILKELGKAIDDRKREVRMMAVPCRTAWFKFNGAV